MKLTPEIIFPGCKIKLGEQNYVVIKVNSKSFYATTMSYSDFLDKWELKLKGTTFIEFCKFNNVKMYKYSEPFEIEENEFNRKRIVAVNSNLVYKIDKYDKATIIDRIKTIKKKKKTVEFTPIFSLSSKKTCYFLKENNGSYLANINKDYILFCPDTDEWLKISTVYDYSEKYDHTPWELLSNFKEQEKVIIA